MAIASFAVVAGMFASRAVQHLSAPASEVISATAAPESEESHVGSHNYVQEPLGHTSYRPNFGSSLRRANVRNNQAMLRAFSLATVDTRASTVQLRMGGEQVALGAIVGADGWIATKASQLPLSGKVACLLYDGTEYLAEVIQKVTDVDLALLRIERSGLPVVQWADTEIPFPGAWLATTDVDRMPSAVGVVSAGPQRVQPAKAVLGVHLVDSTEGAAVTLVLPGSGADEAGLRIGDNIIEVNGVKVTSHMSFKNTISSARGGEVVQLKVSRADRSFDAQARLMDLADELLDETEMEVNGRISARATGFNRVFLHDTVLAPNQCGGPLCNLDGKVVGLNIARAGRVSSYALPADVVRPVLEGLIAQARLVSRPAKQPAEQPVR